MYHKWLILHTTGLLTVLERVDFPYGTGSELALRFGQETWLMLTTGR